MELTFNKVDNHYEATFTATTDFNLHLEKSGTKGIIVYQKTVEDGEYATTASWSTFNKAFDADFGGFVYPKYIKVYVRDEVEKAIVTFKNA